MDVSPQATAIRELFEETAGKPLSPSRKLADSTRALKTIIALSFLVVSRTRCQGACLWRAWQGVAAG